MTFELRPYQQEGVAWLTDVGRGLLGDEMGLGKTPQLLQAAQGRTLVVAPAMILDGGVWENERDKWAPDLDMTTVSYSSLIRRNGRSWTSVPKPEFKGPWDTVIADEAHYLKNRKAHWTKAFSKVAKNSDRTYLATGTPIPNWAYELFPLLQIMDPEAAKPGGELGSYWRWVKRWFMTYPSRHSPHGTEIDASTLLRCTPACNEKQTCEHWVEFYDANLGNRFLQRLRDNVLKDLPPLTGPTPVRVKMKPAQRKAYHELRDDFITWLDNGNEHAALSTAGALTKLAMVATGVQALDADAKPCSSKLDMLRQILEDRSRPTLAVAHFRNSVKAAADVGRSLGLRVETIEGSTSKADRRRIVDAFQAGRVDLLVGSLGVVAEGLTLTAADMVILVERSWTPSKNDQVIRRIHRIGQTRPVTAIDLITDDTVDAYMYDEVLPAKSDAQVRALRAGDLRDRV